MKNVVIVFLYSILAVFAVVKAQDCLVDNRFLRIGQKYSPPGECVEIQCQGQNYISTKTCGSGQPADNSCTFVDQDNSKPFPDCCPTYQC